MADFGGEVRTAIRELSWGECCSRKHGRGSVAGQAGNGPITVIYEHRACGSPLAVTAPAPTEPGVWLASRCGHGILLTVVILSVWNGLGRPVGSRTMAAKFAASSRAAREAAWAAVRIREWSRASGKGDPGGPRSGMGGVSSQKGGAVQPLPLQRLVGPLSSSPSAFGTVADPGGGSGPAGAPAASSQGHFPHGRSAFSSPRRAQRVPLGHGGGGRRGGGTVPFVHPSDTRGSGPQVMTVVAERAWVGYEQTAQC